MIISKAFDRAHTMAMMNDDDDDDDADVEDEGGDGNDDARGLKIWGFFFASFGVPLFFVCYALLQTFSSS